MLRMSFAAVSFCLKNDANMLFSRGHSLPQRPTMPVWSWGFFLFVCFFIARVSLFHAGLEEEQMLLLILSCHYTLVVNTADTGFQQRTWLIHTSINIANYSLMPLTGSQFSQRCLPVPQLIGVLLSLPLLQAASWQSTSRLHWPTETTMDQ